MGLDLSILIATNGEQVTDENVLHCYTRIRVPQNRELFDLIRHVLPGERVKKPVYCAGITTSEGVLDDMYGLHLRSHKASMVGTTLKEYQPSSERRPKEQELIAISNFLLTLPDSWYVILYWS